MLKEVTTAADTPADAQQQTKDNHGFLPSSVQKNKYEEYCQTCERDCQHFQLYANYYSRATTNTIYLRK